MQNNQTQFESMFDETANGFDYPDLTNSGQETNMTLLANQLQNSVNMEDGSLHQHRQPPLQYQVAPPGTVPTNMVPQHQPQSHMPQAWPRAVMPSSASQMSSAPVPMTDNLPPSNAYQAQGGQQQLNQQYDEDHISTYMHQQPQKNNSGDEQTGDEKMEVQQRPPNSDFRPNRSGQRKSQPNKSGNVRNGGRKFQPNQNRAPWQRNRTEYSPQFPGPRLEVRQSSRQPQYQYFIPRNNRGYDVTGINRPTRRLPVHPDENLYAMKIAVDEQFLLKERLKQMLREEEFPSKEMEEELFRMEIKLHHATDTWLAYSKASELDRRTSFKY